MSLTSYRAAPPRDSRPESRLVASGWVGEERVWGFGGPGGDRLFRLWVRQYHGRGGFSRPSSGWDRVLGPSLWPPGLPAERARRCSCQGQACGRLSGGLCHVSGRCLRGAAACLWAPADGGDSARLAPGRVLPLHAGGVRRHQAPVERLVPVSCAGCPASTSGLSTWWSSTALERDLVLRRVSRLDAFSGYPVRT